MLLPEGRRSGRARERDRAVNSLAGDAKKANEQDAADKENSEQVKQETGPGFKGLGASVKARILKLCILAGKMPKPSMYYRGLND